MSQLSPSNIKRTSMSPTVPPAIAADVQILPGLQYSYTSPVSQGILFRMSASWDGDDDDDFVVHPMERRSLPLVLAKGGCCGGISRQNGAMKYHKVFLLRISRWLSWSLTKKARRAPFISRKTSSKIGGFWQTWFTASVYKWRQSCLQKIPWIDNWTSCL